MRDAGHRSREAQIDAACRAFGEQHGDDRPRRAVTEQLAQRLLVKGDAVASDQRDEIRLRIARERGGREMRIVRQKALRARQSRFVKLQRPPPEIRILAPALSVCSSSRTLRPRWPAVSAHIRPAAPAPMTITSAFWACAVMRLRAGERRRWRSLAPMTPAGVAGQSLIGTEFACVVLSPPSNYRQESSRDFICARAPGFSLGLE